LLDAFVFSRLRYPFLESSLVISWLLKVLEILTKNDSSWGAVMACVYHVIEALKWSAFKNSFVAEHGLAVLCNLAIDPEVHVELLTNDAGKLAINYLMKFNDYMASIEIGCKLILKFSENPDHCFFTHSWDSGHYETMYYGASWKFYTQGNS
jgi:hypothetical protein